MWRYYSSETVGFEKQYKFSMIVLNKLHCGRPTRGRHWMHEKYWKTGLLSPDCFSALHISCVRCSFKFCRAIVAQDIYFAIVFLIKYQNCFWTFCIVTSVWIVMMNFINACDNVATSNKSKTFNRLLIYNQSTLNLSWAKPKWGRHSLLLPPSLLLSSCCNRNI